MFAAIRLPAGEIDVISEVDRVMEKVFQRGDPCRIAVREFYDMMKPGPRGLGANISVEASVAFRSRSM